MLLDSDEVGKGLQGMHGSCLHGKDGATRIFDKLIQYRFSVIVFAVGKSCKRAHTNQIAVAAHHGNGLQQMFALVAIHNDTTLCL